MGFLGFLKKGPEAPQSQPQPAAPPSMDPLTPHEEFPEMAEHDLFADVPLQIEAPEEEPIAVPEMPMEETPSEEPLPEIGPEEELPDFSPEEEELARDASRELLEPKTPALPAMERVPRETLDHSPFVATQDYLAALATLTAMKAAVKKGNTNLSKLNASLAEKQRLPGFAHALNNIQVQLLQADDILASTMR